VQRFDVVLMDLQVSCSCPPATLTCFAWPWFLCSADTNLSNSDAINGRVDVSENDTPARAQAC
jgi:hypothetical protein